MGDLLQLRWNQQPSDELLAPRAVCALTQLPPKGNVMAQADSKTRARIVTLLCALSAVSAHADAPPGRYTVNDSTVLDNVTLLTWRSAAAGPYTHAEAA